MDGNTDEKIVFDILGGAPDGAILETMLICGFGIGNVIRAEFGAGKLEPPAYPSEWLAIDIRSIACDHYEVAGGNGMIKYVPCAGSTVRSLKLAEENGAVHRIGFTDIPDLGRYMLDLSAFAEENYGGNVIAFDLRDPEWIATPGRNVVLAGDPDAARRAGDANLCSSELTASLRCRCIRTPSNIIGRGKDSDCMPRYSEGFYAYARDCIRTITSGNPEAGRELRKLGLGVADYMDAARRAPFLSSASFLAKVDEEKEAAADWDGTLAMLLRKMMAAKSEMLKAEIGGRIGIVWRERDDGKADMKKAVYLFRKSADSGVRWARRELLSALWEDGSPDALLEMVSRAYEYSSEGDRDAMEFLGWAYEDGTGLPKNEEESKKWLSKAGRNPEKMSMWDQ